ncbi:MAG: GNAT family N-acetyltransferase [Candidatus Pacebacteria bacterium]|nr:GNAT family N-acetyltransferase [Candidatus Paceibacterota bacterium]MBP9058182.1 GNAT family N-acetyltransferase [Candidatus Paceibacterota bacterium]MBP9769900.1 GNAT family N-acetyltransferase [Candidatus Paceibacterota bacterium]
MLIFKEISINDEFLKEASNLIQEHSWGLDYPVSALDELKESDFIIGCFNNGKLVGLASINNFASPDKIDNGLPWLAAAVVLPEYRGRGIYKDLYEKRIEHLKHKKEKIILSCTDNKIVKKFLLDRGWKLRRITKDESGGECEVFEKNLI